MQKLEINGHTVKIEKCGNGILVHGYFSTPCYAESLDEFKKLISPAK